MLKLPSWAESFVSWSEKKEFRVFLDRLPKTPYNGQYRIRVDFPSIYSGKRVLYQPICECYVDDKESAVHFIKWITGKTPKENFVPSVTTNTEPDVLL